MSGVVTVGETMALISADRIGPVRGGDPMTLTTGGAESNVAIALSRLGVETTWIGRIGDDALGRLVARDIRGEGVTVLVRIDPDAPTGLMVKDRPLAGVQSVAYYRAGSAGSRLAVADLPIEVIGAADLLHVTGITAALSASARATLFAAVRGAKEAGVPVSFDVNHRPALWSRDDAAAFCAELLPLVDIVFAGLEEAGLLSEAMGEPSMIASAVSAAHDAEVVIKLGADGAVAAVGGEVLHRAAVPVDPVDTVGAGDAFVAGYLAERLAGRSLGERLDTAVIAGSLACLVPGDWEGAPIRSELDRARGPVGDPVRR